MALTPQDSRFFGLDLSTLWQDLRRPWQDMHRWPLLAWLAPAVAIRLLQADGSESVWLSGQAQKLPARAKARNTRFVAVELPEDLLLRRTLTLPKLPEAALANAVALEMRSVSPFTPDNLVWGYSARANASGTALQVEAALASRQHIEQYLQSQAARLQGADSPGVWVLSGTQAPIRMGGFGAARLSRYVNLWSRLGYALLALALALMVAMAITPTAQLRLRATEAVHAYTAVQQRAAPLLQRREAFIKATDRLAGLRELLADRVDPLRTMDLLTQALPDDTSLLSVQVQGNKVSLSGQTVNAAALMQQLGTQPGLKDVRAPSPATRPLGAVKESFTIEFTLDTKSLAAAPAAADKASAPVPAGAPAAPAAAPASGPASAPPVAAASAAARPAAPPASAPASAAPPRAPASTPAVAASQPAPASSKPKP